MVSKNNYSEKMRKIRPQKQRFSIRKFTVGAASVLIGLTFIGVNNQEVQADTTVAPEKSVKVESSIISDITETIDNVVNTEDQSVSTANQAEAMSVEENNEVENDVTASGETGNEEVKIDQSISSVETNNVEESATNEVVAYNAASTNEDTAVNNQNTNTTETNLVENTTPVEEVQVVENVKNNVQEAQSTENVETNTVPVEADQPIENTEDSTDSVEELNPIEDENKVENEASPIEESVIKENTTIQSDVKEVQSKASVTIQGTDAEKYPKEAGKLIGKNKYIYQILNLNYTSFRPSQNKKLVLSINRNNLSDENLYAYVTDNGFTKILSTHTIQAGRFKNIEVNNGMYNVKFLVVNSGKSDVTVNENKTPVGNASTVVGSTRIEYCLGNSTDIDARSIGEIIPIYTEQSVIKYYYWNKDGKLVEIPGTDKYPNVNVSGLTSAPIIEGYIADIEYVVPEDTGKDITVIYTANAAKDEIIYVDETTGKQLETAVVDGKYNETINYSTADKIKYYESLGYELVKDGYVGGELGEDTKTFYVTFKHGAVIVTPDDKFTEEDPINPDNPDGPKYPFDSIALDKTITRTVKYVYADETKAKDDVVQKLRFRGTAIIDKVTGEVIILDENGRKISDGIKWTALDGTTFIRVISPDIAGYTPDRKEIGSLENVDSNIDDIIETVVYNKDIVDPEGPKVPAQVETPIESTNDAPILPEQLSPDTTINKVETVENKESGKVEAATTEDVALPQTGHKHSNAGLIGLGLATIASILGLAGTRKRKKD